MSDNFADVQEDFQSILDDFSSGGDLDFAQNNPDDHELLQSILGNNLSNDHVSDNYPAAIAPREAAPPIPLTCTAYSFGNDVQSDVVNGAKEYDTADEGNQKGASPMAMGEYQEELHKEQAQGESGQQQHNISMTGMSNKPRKKKPAKKPAKRRKHLRVGEKSRTANILEKFPLAERVAENSLGGEEVVEKLTTRRDRNREHARKSRLRKKLLVVVQQQRISELEHTNRLLVTAVQKYAPPASVGELLAKIKDEGKRASLEPMPQPELPRSQNTRLTGNVNSAAHLDAELDEIRNLQKGVERREIAVENRERELETRERELETRERELETRERELERREHAAANNAVELRNQRQAVEQQQLLGEALDLFYPDDELTIRSQ